MFLKLKNRSCLVVGAEAESESKIASLLSSGARVRVVAPGATPKIRTWARNGKISWANRLFQPHDLDGVFLVIAAASSSKLRERIYRQASRQGVLCNCVDDPAHCHFYFPAVVRRGALQIAISTSGESPALAQRLRKQLERQFGPEYAPWVEELGLARKALAKTKNPGRRRRLLHELASQDAFTRFSRRGSAARRRGDVPRPRKES
jgi:precorrin-2 dehydrogenase/sirohydrochlorin ferrochelatase